MLTKDSGCKFACMYYKLWTDSDHHKAQVTTCIALPFRLYNTVFQNNKAILQFVTNMLSGGMCQMDLKDNKRVVFITKLLGYTLFSHNGMKVNISVPLS